MVMPMTLGTSIASHAVAIALGAIAAAALLNAHLAEPQSLADYIAAICAKTFHSNRQETSHEDPVVAAARHRRARPAFGRRGPVVGQIRRWDRGGSRLDRDYS